MASQLTSLTIVYSTVYSDADQRKHQSSASLAFVWGIHRWPVNSPHKGPVTQKIFPFDGVIIWFPLGTITKTGVAAPSVTAAQSDVSAFVETMAPAVTGLDEEDDEEDEDRDDERTRDPNQPPPSKRCRRTPRPSVILTDLELEAMAEFLKDNEGLYNKARDMWRDSAARARLFEQQAATMDNRTGPELQQWYEGLRSKIGRLQRKAKKSGTLKDSHVRLLELFKFLTPHIMNVQRRNPAKVSITCIIPQNVHVSNKYIHMVSGIIFAVLQYYFTAYLILDCIKSI